MFKFNKDTRKNSLLFSLKSSENHRLSNDLRGSQWRQENFTLHMEIIYENLET